MAVSVQIKSIIDRLGKKVNFIQPIYEAIANSLEANAKNIKIELHHDTQLNGVTPKITGFKITDDGEGFTESNRIAFGEFWTKNKAGIGCKGSGRFLWLTVFDNIMIESGVTGKSEKVNINFDQEFSAERIIITPQKIEKNYTVLEFKNVTDRFYHEGNNIDTRVNADLDKLCESVQEHLLIKLFMLKNRNVSFNIEFSLNGKTKSIKPNDIPELSNTVFSISSDITNSDYNFTLYYHFFEDNASSKKGYFCANDRATEQMQRYDLGLDGELPNRDSFIILLCSDYFNDKDDDSRNTLNELSGIKQRSVFVPLLLSDIRPRMQQAIKEIVKNKYPQIDELNKKAEEDAINSHPYLASIIREDNDIVKTKTSLIENAHKSFSSKKVVIQNKFSKILKDKSIDEKTFIDAIGEVSDIAAAELGEYIFYRNTIISALETALSDTSKNESFIHNIIMRMKTSANENDDDKYLLSNLWLLDDKFMTYSYAASDKTINQIRNEIQVERGNTQGNSNRPDINIFFNRESGDKDLIMVELKGAHADKNEKNKALTEITNNIDIVHKNIQNVNSVWSYIITAIDEDFKKTLFSQDFVELFSNDKDAKAYYRYFKNINSHVYVIDLRTIVSDAFARNSTFLEILKKAK